MSKKVSHSRYDNEVNNTGKSDKKKAQSPAASDSQAKRITAPIPDKVNAMVRNSIQMQKAEEWQQMANRFSTSQTRVKVNKTGLPDQLKSGVESLSGISMDDVNVHYNSSKPSQLKAHAYARGTDIHLAAGQEKHLPHEAWHVVQQKQGRVRATVHTPGLPAINDDAKLEQEADVMGKKATQLKNTESKRAAPVKLPEQGSLAIQKVKGDEDDSDITVCSKPIWLTNENEKAIVKGLAKCAAIKINVFQTIEDEKKWVASVILHSEGKISASENAADEINRVINYRLKNLTGRKSVEILVMYNGMYPIVMDHQSILERIKKDIDVDIITSEGSIKSDDMYINIDMTGTKDEIMERHKDKLHKEAPQDVVKYREHIFSTKVNRLLINKGFEEDEKKDFIHRWGLTTSIEEVNKMIEEAENYGANKNNDNNSKCYLSTACCTHYGLPDHCEYLDTLRMFRDSWLLSQPAGERKVKEYYRKAPGIVSAIERHEDKEEIYALIFRGIQLATGLIRNGKMQEAALVYESLSRELQGLVEG